MNNYITQKEFNDYKLKTDARISRLMNKVDELSGVLLLTITKMNKNEGEPQ